MDLGIGGRTAIVCASGRGLGRACALALAAEGVKVVINARGAAALHQTADDIRRATDAEVIPIVADITTPDGRARLLDAAPDADILVTNNAGPRPASLDEATVETIEAALEANFLAPFLLMQALVDGMVERRFGRVIHLTSAMVAAPRPHMLPSVSARSALSAAAKASSRDLAPYNVTVNQILPERIDSERQVQMAHDAMARQGISYEEARRLQVASIPAGRLGDPAEVGAACAFLAAATSGYITGTNLRLDGGAYPGAL